MFIYRFEHDQNSKVWYIIEYIGKEKYPSNLFFNMNQLGASFINWFHNPGKLTFVHSPSSCLNCKHIHHAWIMQELSQLRSWCLRATLWLADNVLSHRNHWAALVLRCYFSGGEKKHPKMHLWSVCDKRRLQTCRLAGKWGKPCCGML